MHLMSELPMHGFQLQQHLLLRPSAPVSSQHPHSQRARTTQLSWRTPFFRVRNGSDLLPASASLNRALVPEGSLQAVLQVK